MALSFHSLLANYRERERERKGGGRGKKEPSKVSFSHFMPF